jgi:predicted RND superfamily exporter protein
MIAGEPVMVVEGFRSLESDGRLLATWSTLLVGLVIVVCFRSLRWVVIPLAVVQLSLWLTYGLLVWGGFRMTLVSGMLSAIVTVVGIATAVHVLVAFREGRSLGLSTRAALADAARKMAAPVIWSLVTDAAGFGSLLVSAVGPVRDFGLMTLVGSLLVLPCLVLLVPGLAMAGRWDSTPREAYGERGLGAVLDWTSRLVERYPWRLLAAIAVLAVASIAGLQRLEVETDFTRNFRAGSDLVRSYETIESEFGGAGVLDVILPAPPQLTWDYVKQVARLEERLRAEVQVLDEAGQARPGLTKVLSAADALRAAMPVDPDKLPFAAARNLAVGAAWQAMKARMPAFAATLYAPADAPDSPSWFRVMLRARERQSAAEKTRLIDHVQRIVDEELGTTAWKPLSDRHGAAVTGYYVLLTKLIASTVRDQWLSFGLATLGVFVSLLGALRGVRLSLIALAPNALPIVAVLGGLGWLGLKLNLGAAMIAAVSMGLSVDSSIHYLMAFQRRRQAGLAIGAALRATQQDVGRAVVFSTLALVVGFLVLCRSEFMPTVYFGLLVSLAMLGGLLGNLVLLPALLRVAPLGKPIVATRTAAH